MFTLLCTVSSTTVFSIHVLTSFVHGYSATLAAKLLIKLELSWVSASCIGLETNTAKCRSAPSVKQTGQESGCQLISQFRILIISALKICKQCLQTSCFSFWELRPQTAPTGASSQMKIPSAASEDKYCALTYNSVSRDRTDSRYVEQSYRKDNVTCILLYQLVSYILWFSYDHRSWRCPQIYKISVVSRSCFYKLCQVDLYAQFWPSSIKDALRTLRVCLAQVTQMYSVSNVYRIELSLSSFDTDISCYCYSYLQ